MKETNFGEQLRNKILIQKAQMVNNLYRDFQIEIQKSITNSKDPSHGGKLILVHRIDKNGKHSTKWISKEDAEKEKSDYEHHEQVGVGHRVVLKNGEKGTILKDKGHNGKGHLAKIKTDSGKEADYFLHNVQHINPKEEKEDIVDKKQAAKPKVLKPKTTNEPKVEQNQTNQTEETESEFELKPRERMAKYKRDVFKFGKAFKDAKNGDADAKNRAMNALVAYGTGGVGKTYNTIAMLEAAGLKKDVDFVTFTGGTSASGMFSMLKENSDKLIILDDFDDVFEDKETRDMLKGACDTSKVRKITRLKAGKAPSKADKQVVNFTGKILFISNLNFDKILEEANMNDSLTPKQQDIAAIYSRSSSNNLRMNSNEVIEMIDETIIHKEPLTKAAKETDEEFDARLKKNGFVDENGNADPNKKVENDKFVMKDALGNVIPSSYEDKIRMINFMKKNKNELSEISVRTMVKMNALRAFYKKERNRNDWEKIAEGLFTKSGMDDMDVNERFEYSDDITEMVGKGYVKSQILFGRGGLGKTYGTINSLVNNAKLKEVEADDHSGLNGDGSVDMDKRKEEYVHFQGGSMSATALYEALFRHNGRTIVIDDAADGILTDTKAQNILKGALDTSGSGQINKLVAEGRKPTKVWIYPPDKNDDEDDEDYASRLSEEGFNMNEEGEFEAKGVDVPDQFDFKGKVIFISNLPKEKLAQPLQSRSMTVNTAMSEEQGFQRMLYVADSKKKKGTNASHLVEDATHEDEVAVINHMKKIHNELVNGPDKFDKRGRLLPKGIPKHNFNMRIIHDAMRIKKDAEEDGLDWKPYVKERFSKSFELGGIAYVSDFDIIKSMKVLFKK